MLPVQGVGHVGTLSRLKRHNLLKKLLQMLNNPKNAINSVIYKAEMQAHLCTLKSNKRL